MYLIIIGWIRIRMDPELLPGSGSRKNHSGSTTLVSTQVHNLKVFEYKLLCVVDPDQHESRSGIIFPDPAKNERTDNKLISNFRPLNSELFAL